MPAHFQLLFRLDTDARLEILVNSTSPESPILPPLRSVDVVRNIFFPAVVEFVMALVGVARPAVGLRAPFEPVLKVVPRVFVEL